MACVNHVYSEVSHIAHVSCFEAACFFFHFFFPGNPPHDDFTWVPDWPHWGCSTTIPSDVSVPGAIPVKTLYVHCAVIVLAVKSTIRRKKTDILEAVRWKVTLDKRSPIRLAWNVVWPELSFQYETAWWWTSGYSIFKRTIDPLDMLDFKENVD